MHWSIDRMVLRIRQSALMMKIEDFRLSRLVRRSNTRSKMTEAPICEAQLMATRMPHCRMYSICSMSATNGCSSGPTRVKFWLHLSRPGSTVDSAMADRGRTVSRSGEVGGLKKRVDKRYRNTCYTVMWYRQRMVPLALDPKNKFGN